MVNDYYYREYARIFQKERLKAGRQAQLLKASGRSISSRWPSLPRLGLLHRIRRRQNHQTQYRPETASGLSA